MRDIPQSPSLHDAIGHPAFEFPIGQVIHCVDAPTLHQCERRLHLDAKCVVKPCGRPSSTEIVNFSLPAAIRELDDLRC
jgi:hypothetical protein